MFYRLRVPLGALGDQGHDTSWGVGVNFDDAKLDRDSVLVGQLLNGEQDLDFWRWLASVPDRPLMVYEVDDDLFTMDQVITDEIRRGRKLIWADPATQKRVKEFMKLADLVTVATPHLATLYQPYARRIAVLPNMIPDWAFDLTPAYPDAFTVGWSVSQSHMNDASNVAPSLMRFFRRAPYARMHWIGPHALVHTPTRDGVPVGPPEPGSGLLPSDRETRESWIGSVPEYLNALPGKMTVGIAPLGPFPFNKGKSGLKAQEYAAVGVPCVVADWPQYRAVVRHGVTGYLAHTRGDWSDMLDRLYRSPGLWKRMGTAARNMEAKRRASQRCHLWTDAYREAQDAR